MANTPRKIEGRGNITLICPACNKEFIIFKAHYRGGSNACSKECSAKIRPRKQKTFVNCTCKECNKQFQVKKYRENSALYCSKQCLANARGRKMAGENHPLWNGGSSKRSYSSRKTINQIIKEKQCCEECGSKNSLQGHHIKSHSSHLPGRADPNNIQVLCVFCHAKKHPNLSKFILAGHAHA
jgi:HNH endonuclease